MIIGSGYEDRRDPKQSGGYGYRGGGPELYLTLYLTPYGNDATLGNTVIGSDTTTLRKTAAEVIRNCGLTRMVDANMGNVIDAGHNTMFRLKCRKIVRSPSAFPDRRHRAWDRTVSIFIMIRT